MSEPIDVIGIGAEGPAGLRPELLARIRAAEFLAGGERHLSFFPEAVGDRFVIRDNLRDLLTELTDRYGRQRCVVLASGDPLFFGIGRFLVGALGPAVRVEPAIGSMQLAFARAGIAWQDATLASVHGRELRPVLLPLLGKPLLGLFTPDGDGPAAVARFLVSFGLEYEAVVGEDLGTPEERVTRHPDLATLTGQHFAALNYLILHRTSHSVPPEEVRRNRASVPGVPDELFARPADAPEVMTRQEVRSVVLAKLLRPLAPGDVVWDVGAGLGTVAVEVAVLRPQAEVVAVERDPARAALLRENRLRFDAFNVRVVEGSAPAALAGETEPPQAAFVGGSGRELAGILELVHERLRPRGRLVASFVTLENLFHTLERVRAWGWAEEVTELQVSRGDRLAGLTGLKPMRGVFVVRADKPGDGP